MFEKFFSMGFLDKLGRTIQIWISDDEEDEVTAESNIDLNKEKGDKFERYVVEIFRQQKKFFDIIDWTSDNCNKRKGLYVESDKNPDLRLRYKWKGKDEQFAVECKYRSYLYRNKKFNNQYMLNWTYPAKIKQYNEYSRKNKIPVFIVVGLGGEPDNPEGLFCIPLEEAKYPNLFTNVLEKYEGNTENPSFFWKGKEKSLTIK